MANSQNITNPSNARPDRRDFLRVGTKTAAGLAASTVAGTALILPAAAAPTLEPSLSTLVHRYWTECDAFNNTDWDALAFKEYGDTDADSVNAVFDELADTTFKKTLDEMLDVPARTLDDVLAAFNWLVREEAELTEDPDHFFYLPIVVSLTTAIRDYLVSIGGRS